MLLNYKLFKKLTQRKKKEKPRKDQNIILKFRRLKIKLCVIFLSPEAPVDGDVIIQQDVRQASFGAVLCDDSDEGDLDGTTNEFA